MRLGQQAAVQFLGNNCFNLKFGNQKLNHSEFLDMWNWQQFVQ